MFFIRETYGFQGKNKCFSYGKRKEGRYKFSFVLRSFLSPCQENKYGVNFYKQKMPTTSGFYVVYWV